MWQENVGFESVRGLPVQGLTFYSLCYEQRLKISKAGRRRRKTDQDSRNYSVIISIAITHDRS